MMRSPKKIAEAGGRAATRFLISANERSFMKTGLTRPSNGWSAWTYSLAQNFSIGESPITIASVVVFGSVRKMFPKIVCRSVESVTIVSLGVSVASLIALASRAAKITGVEKKRSRLWRWMKRAAGLTSVMIKSGGWVGKRARR